MKPSFRGGLSSSRPNSDSKTVGYEAQWTTQFEICSPDGFEKGSCVTTYANATSNNIQYTALRDSNPTIRSNSQPFRYADERLPGPTIDVTEGDLVDVTLLNHLPQTGTSVHWHGQDQRGTNYMDGVPGVTQCAVQPFGEFEYKFEAYPSGTGLYHSHMFGGQSSDGLSGPLIVRARPGQDPHEHLYDEEKILFVSDWTHGYSSQNIAELVASYISSNASTTGAAYYDSINSPSLAKYGGYKPLSDEKWEATLINGKGRYAEDPEAGNTEIFTLQEGKTYRFRTICASGSWTYNITAQDHEMTVIAVDGFDIQPYQVESIILAPGQRADFLIKANKPVNNYRLDVSTLNGLNVPAILQYVGAPEPTLEEKLFGINGTSDNYFNGGCSNAIGCPNNRTELNLARSLRDVKPATPTRVPKGTNIQQVNITFAGGDNLNIDPLDSNYIPGGTTAWYLSINEGPFTQFVIPKYPTALWKWNNVDTTWAIQKGNSTTKFTGANLLDKYGNPIQGEATYGANVVNVPYNQVVDVVLNNPTAMAHPMHLHGQRFWALGSGTDASYFNSSLHELNEVDPIKLDTILVPAKGWTVIRFKADNPGWWAFHCHIDPHFATGMTMAFNVAENKQSPPPKEGVCDVFKTKRGN